MILTLQDQRDIERCLEILELHPPWTPDQYEAHQARQAEYWSYRRGIKLIKEMRDNTEQHT